MDQPAPQEPQEAPATDPFSIFQIADFTFLNSMEREQCPICKSSRKQICYKCLRPMGDATLFPKLQLPIQMDILHWPAEARSKSTAVHASIIAPDCTRFIDWPDIPEYNPEETVLLYPTNDAKAVSDFPNIEKIKRVVFVDSQWHSAGKILREPNVEKIPHIKIKNHKTLFWRYQEVGEECLATIEAIYYFFQEYHLRTTGNYNGEFDNLLWLFKFNWSLIQDKYTKDRRHFPRIDNYVPMEGVETINRPWLKQKKQQKQRKGQAKKQKTESTDTPMGEEAKPTTKPIETTTEQK